MPSDCKPNRAALTKAMQQQFAGLDRTAFAEQLALVMMQRPTDARVKAFANKFPDRWANMIATFARLAGFTDRSESVNLHAFVSLQSLSDIELEAELSKLTSQLDTQRASNNSLTVVDAQCTELNAPSADDPAKLVD
jgi:hypothetical protein